ncbi:MAG: radical SAM protein [Deltaproteobacteria bacterium]|jgi:sulfatase maturation enzyme AslB (radical SAM superfamily)|nr:radical SAM protein [Deltaproteobacteria bacterium]
MKLSLVHKDSGKQDILYDNDGRYYNLLTEAFGERFLQYRKLWKEREERDSYGSFPLSLDLAINSGCQLSCIMCPNSLQAKEKPRLMERRFFKKLMLEAKEHRLPALTLGLGTEPLLHPLAPEFIGLASKAGVMDIRLGTNGAALTPRLTDSLIDSGLTRLEVSLDAVYEKTYAAIRIGGNYNRLMRKIEYFLEKRQKLGRTTPLLRVSFLKLPQNAKELVPFLATWKDRADMISIQNPVSYEGLDWLKPQGLKKQVLPKKVSCAQPWQRVGVLEDGTVWPCCSFYGKYIFKRETIFGDIACLWHSRSMNQLRKSLKTSPIEACRLCSRTFNQEV